MKKAFLIICILITINSLGQKKATEETDEMTSKIKFEHDLKNNNLKLYFIGGIAPMIKEHDYEFQKKYGIYFYDFGCLPPPNFDFYTDYNMLVFQYLTTIHKQSWKVLFRQDALGYQKWEKYNK